jgi:hypothetical protein
MKRSVERDATRLSMGVVLLCCYFFWLNHPPGDLLSPVPKSPSYSRSVVFAADLKAKTTLSPTPTPRDVDVFVGEAVDEFFPDPSRQSEVRMILHCLLNRETKHDVSKGHGDGGLAGGSLQYHEATWQGYRTRMMKAGVATEISTRYDLKEAIRITVWAIKNKRATAWGPILRTTQGRTDATCPAPSWY